MEEDRASTEMKETKRLEDETVERSRSNSLLDAAVEETLTAGMSYHSTKIFPYKNNYVITINGSPIAEVDTINEAHQWLSAYFLKLSVMSSI